MAKYGMSMCVLGHGRRIPRRRHRRQRPLAAHRDRHRRAADDPAASTPRQCRKPEILADAAHAHPHQRQPHADTGNFFIDDEVLAEEGVRDLTPYAVDPDKPLLQDLFLD